MYANWNIWKPLWENKIQKVQSCSKSFHEQKSPKQEEEAAAAAGLFFLNVCAWDQILRAHIRDAAEQLFVLLSSSFPSNNTRNIMGDMYVVRVSVCMDAGLSGAGMRGAGISIGSTASTVQQGLVQGCRSAPSMPMVSPLPPELRVAWRGSLAGFGLQAVSQQAFLHWRLVCLLGEKKQKDRENYRLLLWPIRRFMATCFWGMKIICSSIIAQSSFPPSCS